MIAGRLMSQAAVAGVRRPGERTNPERREEFVDVRSDPAVRRGDQFGRGRTSRERGSCRLMARFPASWPTTGSTPGTERWSRPASSRTGPVPTNRSRGLRTSCGTTSRHCFPILPRSWPARWWLPHDGVRAGRMRRHGLGPRWRAAQLATALESTAVGDGQPVLGQRTGQAPGHGDTDLYVGVAHLLAGYLVIALTAWSLDEPNARGTAEDARLKAFVDQDRRSAVVEPDAVERLGPPAPRRVEARNRWGGESPSRITAPLFVPGGRPSAPLRPGRRPRGHPTTTAGLMRSIDKVGG